MNVTAQKLQSLYELVCKSSAWSNQRTTLPQSRIRSTAPSEREPGTPSSGRIPFIVPPGNRNVAGDFHRPYEGRIPFNVPPGNRNVAGDFHRPYETLNI